MIFYQREDEYVFQKDMWSTVCKDNGHFMYLWMAFIPHGPFLSVQTFAALDRKEAYFKKRQGSRRKEIETAFRCFARKISYSTTGKARMERRNYHFDHFDF